MIFHADCRRNKYRILALQKGLEYGVRRTRKGECFNAVLVVLIEEITHVILSVGGDYSKKEARD